MRGPGREREWCTLCSGWVGPWDLKVLTLLFDGSEIWLTSRFGKYPTILWFTRVLYIPDGAGFCSINSSSLTCVMQVIIGSIWGYIFFQAYLEESLLWGHFTNMFMLFRSFMYQFSYGVKMWRLWIWSLDHVPTHMALVRLNKYSDPQPYHSTPSRLTKSIFTWDHICFT